MSLTVVTGPSFYAVTLAEAMSHLRENADPGSYIAGILIPGAQAMVEELTGRRLTTTTLRLGLEAWPDDDELFLPGPPIASVTSLTYLDTNNVRQTLAATEYVVETDAGLIVPAYGVTWPSILEFTGSIKVTYVAGWTSTATIPASLRAAVLLACGHKHENREATIAGTTMTEIPMGLEALCAPWDVRDRVA